MMCSSDCDDVKTMWWIGYKLHCYAPLQRPTWTTSAREVMLINTRWSLPMLSWGASECCTLIHAPHQPINPVPLLQRNLLWGYYTGVDGHWSPIRPDVQLQFHSVIQHRKQTTEITKEQPTWRTRQRPKWTVRERGFGTLKNNSVEIAVVKLELKTYRKFAEYDHIFSVNSCLFLWMGSTEKLV